MAEGLATTYRQPTVSSPFSRLTITIYYCTPVTHNPSQMS